MRLSSLLGSQVYLGLPLVNTNTFRRMWYWFVLTVKFDLSRYSTYDGKRIDSPSFSIGKIWVNLFRPWQGYGETDRRGPATSTGSSLQVLKCWEFNMDPVLAEPNLDSDPDSVPEINPGVLIWHLRIDYIQIWLEFNYASNSRTVWKISPYLPMSIFPTSRDVGSESKSKDGNNPASAQKNPRVECAILAVGKVRTGLTGTRSHRLGFR